MKFEKIKQIAKGWSSNIWLCKVFKNKKEFLCVLKEVRDKSPRKNLAEREGFYLKKANSKNIGPKLFEVNTKKNYVLMEYINGKNFLDWIVEENYSKEELWRVIKEIYKQLLILDELKISHNQLQVGKNILISKKNNEFFPTIIDFEKATTKEKTKNIGQIESFLFYNPNGIVAKKVREKLGLELS